MSPFENYVGDQFSRLEEWYGWDLQRAWPHIQPMSAVGNIALDLIVTEEEATRELAYTRERLFDGDEVDKLLYEDEFTLAQDTLDLARARQRVFNFLYSNVSIELCHGPAEPPTYTEAIDKSLQRELRDQGKRWLPEDKKEELARFAQEVCLFLNLESDLHFTQQTARGQSSR